LATVCLEFKKKYDTDSIIEDKVRHDSGKHRWTGWTERQMDGWMGSRGGTFANEMPVFNINITAVLTV